MFESKLKPERQEEREAKEVKYKVSPIIKNNLKELSIANNINLNQMEKASLTSITKFPTINIKQITSNLTKNDIDKIILIQSVMRRYLVIKHMEQNGIINKTNLYYDIAIIKGFDFLSIKNEKIEKGYQIFENLYYLTYNNGSSFLGQTSINHKSSKIINLIADGLGTLTKINMDCYKGYVKLNKSEGYGCISYSNGGSYEGLWVNDYADGIGIEIFCDSSYYHGEFINGVKNGYGFTYLTDGSIYSGEYKNNIYNGYGIFQFTDKRIYQGQWTNGKLNGYGEFIWPDGKRYIGYYKDDKKSGFGMYLWTNPYKMFVGFWINGLQGGVGKIVYIKEGERSREKWGIYNNSKREKKLNDLEEAKEYMTEEESKYINLFDYFTFERVINTNPVSDFDTFQN